MSEASSIVQLKSSDGHELDAYVARPAGEPIAGLVVIQEIFGVTKHIQSVADGYARDGFLAVAPAIFDRFEKNVQLSYDGDDSKKAYALMGKYATFMKEAEKTDRADALQDIAAALNYARAETGGKVGTIGYCFGGLLSWLSASRLDPSAAVGYYAGGIGNYAQETPKAPVMLHFGRQDTHIPAEQVEKVHAAHPEVQIFWYDDAGHAFNRDVGASYNPAAAKLARERSLAFLKEKLA